MGLTPSSLRRAAKAQLHSTTVDFGNNPNPANFELQKVVQVGAHLVAEVRYPDATNYEGVKVMVYLHLSASQLYQATSLDPHFQEAGGGMGRTKSPAPFARFSPTFVCNLLY